MFSVFGEGLLDPINKKASAENVLEWKRSKKTKACYKLLLDKMNNSEDTYMEQILQKIWPSGEATNYQIAFAISVCQAVLNPNNNTLSVSEDIVKRELAKNLVCIFCFFFYLFNFKIIRSTSKHFSVYWKIMVPFSRPVLMKKYSAPKKKEKIQKNLKKLMKYKF